MADIGRQIKRMQANLVETINSRGCFSVIAQAELGDIEYLKRVKKALSDEV